MSEESIGTISTLPPAILVEVLVLKDAALGAGSRAAQRYTWIDMPVVFAEIDADVAAEEQANDQGVRSYVCGFGPE